MVEALAGRLRRQALMPRVLTGVIGIPLLLGLLWIGGVWWLGLAAVILVLAVMEFAPLRALSPGTELALRVGALLAFVIIAAGPGALARWAVLPWALVLFGFGVIPLMRAGLAPSPGAAPAATSLLLGVAYLPTAFAMLVRWRWELTPQSVLAFLIVIWANDIAAYFIGVAIGRHKLAPRVSPGKSWEGGFGGLAGGVAAGLFVAPWLDLATGPAAIWAAAVTIVSQAGDLFESALKRQAGVKDSGRLLPGHGGVLDRFDGILIAGPIAYIFLRMLAGR